MLQFGEERMTQMSDAFARAGLTRIDYEAAAAALKFINSGGSREAWIQAFDRAAASKRSTDQDGNDGNVQASVVQASPPKPSEGQINRVGNNQARLADARPPITSGHERDAQRGQNQSPIPAVGHEPIAPQGHMKHVDGGKPITSGAAMNGASQKAIQRPPPAREPTQRYLHAMAESRRATAKVQLEIMKTSNGVVWGDIRPREFAGMIRDGHMAWAIKEAFGPFNPRQENMQLREFLPDAVFKKAITLAEVNHVS
jgi:hypothetical protein